MSNAGTTIFEIQRLLSTSDSWNSEVAEEINNVLMRNGYTDHVSHVVWQNRHLRAQLTDELADVIGNVIHTWSPDDLEFDVEDHHVYGWASSIVQSLHDLWLAANEDRKHDLP